MSENKEPKQVIVMRKDLNMRKGKMCAQAAHASLAVILRKMVVEQNYDMVSRMLVTIKDSPFDEWLTNRFKKVVLSCDSEQEIIDIESKCNELRIPNALITDAGLTEFDGVPTKTCIAIGPWDPDEIDKVTGNLKLL
jgi:PTH2 family peptidyl-tRNA hydrolase